ncbi:MAG: hypothetical protein AUI14_01360 [Actinobacteria bacterium 13_2_20CM_2_71_6]|nr:MAG: hypothetical protein AUI14_01360 [Actinobacteria bacterium 13_2_20CM_2_71_6]
MLDVYARLSRAYNGETIQVDDQVEVCLEKLEARGAVVGEVFKDNSLSAWKPNVVRKDWEALMRRLESGISDGVIVYDLTRFSRKVIEGERLVELAAQGARVWSLSGEYDLTTADGRRHFREAMVAAAGESDKISERVRRGKLRKARRGKPSGGGRGFGMPGWAPVPAGWEPGDARVKAPDEQVDAEREIVRECYRRLLAGEELGSGVADLNRRGVTTVTGGRWMVSTLGTSLRRAGLAGLRGHNGAVVGVLAGVEPVVSREEWERLCGLFDGRRRGRPAGRVHWASGLLRCSRCGQPLAGVWRRHYTPYPDGAARREYRCRNDVDHDGCGYNHIDARLAEQVLADAVKRPADPGDHLNGDDQSQGPEPGGEDRPDRRRPLLGRLRAQTRRRHIGVGDVRRDRGGHPDREPEPGPAPPALPRVCWGHRLPGGLVSSSTMPWRRSSNSSNGVAQMRQRVNVAVTGM